MRVPQARVVGAEEGDVERPRRRRGEPRRGDVGQPGARRAAEGVGGQPRAVCGVPLDQGGPHRAGDAVALARRRPLSRRLRAPQRRALQAAAHLVRREPRGGGAQASDVPEALARGRRRAGRGAPRRARRRPRVDAARRPLLGGRRARRPRPRGGRRRRTRRVEARARRHRRARHRRRASAAGVDGERARREARGADVPVAPRHLPPERQHERPPRVGRSARVALGAVGARSVHGVVVARRRSAPCPPYGSGTCRRRCRAGCCRRSSPSASSL